MAMSFSLEVHMVGEDPHEGQEGQPKRDVPSNFLVMSCDLLAVASSISRNQQVENE